MDTFVGIMFVILWFLRLVIGVQLFVTARRNNLRSLYWLGSLFFINVIGLAFANVKGNPFGALSFSYWLPNGFGIFSNLFLIIFLRTTFYMNTRSPHRIFVGIHLVLSAIGIYGLALSGPNGSNLSPYVTAISWSSALVWTWHIVIARRSFVSISQDEAVEDWVRARYQLMTWYSVSGVIFVSFNALRSVLSPEAGVWVNIVGLVTIFTNILTVVLQFLVWVMPEGFRRWLNRNQQIHTEEKHREQAQVILNILGSAMSEGTGLSSLSAMLAIRKTIGQEIETEDSTKITERAIAMGYNDWQALLKNSDLYLWVESLGIKGNPRQAIENATLTLTEKQSLFTMQAK